jgi:hypothetical protein
MAGYIKSTHIAFATPRLEQLSPGFEIFLFEKFVLIWKFNDSGHVAGGN